MPKNFLQWHCLDADDEPEIWLRYYASHEEREAWAAETGEVPPPAEIPPYPRAMPGTFLKHRHASIGRPLWGTRAGNLPCRAVSASAIRPASSSRGLSMSHLRSPILAFLCVVCLTRSLWALDEVNADLRLLPPVEDAAAERGDRCRSRLPDADQSPADDEAVEGRRRRCPDAGGPVHVAELVSALALADTRRMGQQLRSGHRRIGRQLDHAVSAHRCEPAAQRGLERPEDCRSTTSRHLPTTS